MEPQQQNFQQMLGTPQATPNLADECIELSHTDARISDSSNCGINQSVTTIDTIPDRRSIVSRKSTKSIQGRLSHHISLGSREESLISDDLCAICFDSLSSPPVALQTKSNETINDNEQVCDDCKQKAKSKTLKCNHSFHEYCIDQWSIHQNESSQAPKCPLCKQELSFSDLPHSLKQKYPQTTFLITWSNKFIYKIIRIYQILLLIAFVAFIFILLGTIFFKFNYAQYYEEYPERLYQQHDDYALFFTYNANENDVNGLILVTISTMLLIENSYFIHFYYLYLEKCQQIRVPSQWIMVDGFHIPQIGYGTLLLLWIILVNFLQIICIVAGYSIFVKHYVQNDSRWEMLVSNLAYTIGFANTIPMILGILFFIDAIERHGIVSICRAMFGIIVCCQCKNWINWTHPY